MVFPAAGTPVPSPMPALFQKETALSPLFYVQEIIVLKFVRNLSVNHVCRYSLYFGLWTGYAPINNNLRMPPDMYL